MIEEAKNKLSSDFPSISDMSLDSFVSWACSEIMQIRKSEEEVAEFLSKAWGSKKEAENEK